MKQIGLVLLCCAWVACKAETGSGSKDKLGRKSIQGSQTPDKAKMPEKQAPEPPDPRILLLEAEWNKYADTLITHDASSLPEKERQMLGSLVQASQLIEELHMLQIHPDTLKWRDQFRESGSEIERRLFQRNQMPWCVDDTSPDCCAIKAKPKRQIGAVHWPEDWKASEWSKLKTAINERELLSPFTIVRRNEDGAGYRAISYARTELLGPKMRKVSNLLREASKYAPHKSLAAFLSGRADAFESDSAFPYDDSDYLWIALEGDWEVTVGPYEVYGNPHQTKALFEMFIGKENKAVTAELSAFKSNLQEMEESLKTLVGEEVYQPRQLNPRIAIRAVDVWMAAGDGRRSRGATVAFHLPNRGKAVEEGLYKKVILVNHQKAFAPVSKARAALILSPGQQGEVSHGHAVLNTVFHELAHGFGAHHEMSIINLEGKRTTVKKALKEYDSLLEELKADALGLWLSQHQEHKKQLDEAGLNKRYVSALVHMVGLFQYPLEDTYSRMAAVQLGLYLDAGAVIWNTEEGCFTVVLEKMPGAVESLARQVATIQLKGDFSGAETLVKKYVDKTGDGQYALKGALTQIRETVLDKFKKAGIKSPSLRYEIKGL